MQDIIYGASTYLQGLKLIARHRLWVYFLIPILLSLILGVSIFNIAWGLSDNLGSWVMAYYPVEWGKSTFEKIAVAAGGLGIIAFSLLIFRYIIMAVAAPFMSLLSEKLEEKIYPDRPRASFSLPKMLSDLVRGIRIALRNVFRELLFMLLLFVIGIIVPFITPAIPFLLILLQAYYAGFGNFDYTLERRLNVRQSVKFVKANRMLAIGNGLVFVLLLMTVVGFLFALPLGTAAGTVVVLEELEE